jgi:hypothetical protein
MGYLAFSNVFALGWHCDSMTVPDLVLSEEPTPTFYTVVVTDKPILFANDKVGEVSSAKAPIAELRDEASPSSDDSGLNEPCC